MPEPVKFNATFLIHIVTVHWLATDPRTGSGTYVGSHQAMSVQQTQTPAVAGGHCPGGSLSTVLDSVVDTQ